MLSVVLINRECNSPRDNGIVWTANNFVIGRNLVFVISSGSIVWFRFISFVSNIFSYIVSNNIKRNIVEYEKFSSYHRRMSIALT